MGNIQTPCLQRQSEPGYDLTEEEFNEAFEKFKALADKKKDIFDRDIEAILTKGIDGDDARYKLNRFVINAGNTITTTASVVLNIDGEDKEGISSASGPIDAAFSAIEKCLDKDIVLEDYSLQSVTEGTDALGYATIKLRYNGEHYLGRAISIDVIEASINAYIDAINRIG